MEFNKIKSCLTAIITIFIASCTKDVTNVKLPEFEQKLLINSFISPDLTVNELTIDCTRSDFGKLSFPDPPGKVSIFLSNGTNEVRIDTTLLKSHFNKILVKNMPLVDGKSFKIKVVSDKGLTAEASCSVPVKRDFHIVVDTTRLLSTDPDGRNKYSTLSVNVSITDFPGESNYFRLLVSGQSYGNTRGSEIRGIFDVGDQVISDNGRDGKKFVLRSLTFFAENVDSIAKVDSSFLRIYLLNTDKAYYDFHKSLLTFSFGGGDPFAEPSPLYSNISNGIGIFAAYVVDSLIFRIK